MPISGSAKELITFIRVEKQRRLNALSDYAEDEFGDQWFTSDLPFVNDLALMVIATIRHDFERQLVRLAARVTHDDQPISHSAYLKNVRDERQRVRTKSLAVLEDKLPLNAIPEWKGSMELLRLLANCYKHDPWMEPDDDLCTHLRLLPRDSYMTLPESDAVRKAVAAEMCLPADADYCDIADSLIERADAFLNDLSKKVTLARVRYPRPRLRSGK